MELHTSDRSSKKASSSDQSAPVTEHSFITAPRSLKHVSVFLQRKPASDELERHRAHKRDTRVQETMKVQEQLWLKCFQPEESLNFQ